MIFGYQYVRQCLQILLSKIIVYCSCYWTKIMSLYFRPIASGKIDNLDIENSTKELIGCLLGTMLMLSKCSKNLYFIIGSFCNIKIFCEHLHMNQECIMIPRLCILLFTISSNTITKKDINHWEQFRDTYFLKFPSFLFVN